MGGGGKGGGGQSGKVEFPAYMQTFHQEMLDDLGTDTLSTSLVECFNIAVAGASPYASYLTDTDALSVLFGTSSTMDTDTVFAKLKEYTEVDFDTTFLAYVTDGNALSLIDAMSDTLDEEIDIKILPKFKANMRGIGAVQSSAYVIGESLIWDAKVKAIAQERMRLNEFGLKLTSSYIENKKQMAFAIADVSKVFYSLKYEKEDHYAQMNEKNLTWDLEMFQYLNSGLASISGAPSAPRLKSPSKVGSAISGALSGAAAGAMVGMAGGPAAPITAPMGAAIGGALGLAGGLLS